MIAVMNRRRPSHTPVVLTTYFFFSLVLLASSAQAETSILLTLMNASQSVVQIEAENAQKVRRLGPNSQTMVSAATYVRTGTGIIIDSKGIIATNAHTIIQAARIRIHTFDGQTYNAVPVVVDRANDLCLLRINPENKLPPLRLADVSKVALQSRIYSIGGSQLLRNTLSEGKVTGIAFSKQLNKSISKRRAQDIKLFQVNIDLYQGDSGSPIFNASGEVIGIISAAAQRRGKTTFVVPASLMSAHLASLSRREQSAPSPG
jgi:S1-C subfamily serine protease